MPEEQFVNVDIGTLHKFIIDVFVKLGAPRDQAKTIADVLIASDERGIDSHGIGRLLMYYNRIQRKQQEVNTTTTIERETPATAVLNAHNGMGQPASKMAMEMAIKKAKKYGIGMVTVGESNHFGIAGYYALLAAENDCIGICGTNARPSIAPTWSTEPVLGTNPLTIAIPTDWPFIWCADHATSITQRGKIETYARLGKDCPPGWVIDIDGKPATDSKKILKDMMDFTAALVPIGGIGEELAGYKGYNYATLVEVLSSCLCQANFLQACLGMKDGKSVPYRLGHFFIAISVAAFEDVKVFKKRTGDLFRQLAAARKMPGADHIYIAGEKEYIASQERRKNGIPISEETQKQMMQIRDELGLTDKYPFPFTIKYQKSTVPGW